MDHNTQEVEESHLVDCIVNAEKGKVPQNSIAKEKLYADLIDRGLHIHVWTWHEMIKFIQYMIRNRGTSFGLLELSLPKKIKHEVIFILQKREDLTDDEATSFYNLNLEILLKREAALMKIFPKSWYFKRVIGSAINKLLKR